MPPHPEHHPPHDHDHEHHGPHHEPDHDGPHPHGPFHHHGPHHHHVHHCLEGDLGVLRELARRDRNGSTETLLALAGQLSVADEVTLHLQRILEEYGDIAAGQALDLADMHFSAKAEQRIRKLLDRQGDGTGLIFPLPPHIHEPFIDHGGATILIPSGHHLPPHLARSGVRVIDGTRACRKAVAADDLTVVVFEMYRSHGHTLVDEEVGDVLSAVRASTELWAQLRPHAHPEDVEFELSVPLQLV